MGAIAVPSVTCCRCYRCRGYRCAGGVRQWQRATVASPTEWQCGMRRLAVANRPNIFQIFLIYIIVRDEEFSLVISVENALYLKNGLC